MSWSRATTAAYIVTSVAVAAILGLTYYAASILGGLYDTSQRQDALLVRQEAVVEAYEAEIERRERAGSVDAERVNRALSRIEHIDETLTEQTEELDQLLKRLGVATDEAEHE